MMSRALGEDVLSTGAELNGTQKRRLKTGCNDRIGLVEGEL